MERERKEEKNAKEKEDMQIGIKESIQRKRKHGKRQEERNDCEEGGKMN
jgi:hypothetical protein